MKHKHYDMIVAKATDMELVVCINNYGKWEFGDLRQLVDLDAFPAFLCLPQHKEACLHWLNGGDAQIKNPSNPTEFDDVAPFSDRPYWESSRWFMRDDRESRIKPRTEKRWIAIDVLRGDVYTCTEKSKPALGYQIIEIDVEV